MNINEIENIFSSLTQRNVAFHFSVEFIGSPTLTLYVIGSAKRGTSSKFSSINKYNF